MTASAGPIELQGQNKGDTNTWTTGNLMGWVELDYIPARVYFSRAPVSDHIITLFFPHLRGTTPGFQNLYNFRPSANAIITSGPTLATDPSGNYSYTFTVSITNNQPGFVRFEARLAAGAHLNTGSSLQLNGNPQSMGQLQIFKPGPGAGLPDLGIVKTGPATIPQGGTITYTLTYTNKADATNAAIGAQICDILPAGIVLITNSLPPGVELVGNNMFCDLTNVPAHSGGQLVFQALVPLATPVGRVLTNFAQILSSEDDANFLDNSSQWLTAVTQGCISPTITNNPVGATKCPGDSVTFAVGANGTNLRYQWRKNSSNILNATNSSYTISSVSSADSGTYDVTVTNACGNAISAPAVLNATDTQNPIINCPTNIILNADPGQCSRSNVTFTASASDNCAVASVVSIPPSGSTFPVGITAVTNIATDTSGNQSICTFTVMVKDSQAPTISCPPTVTVSANDGCSATNVSLGSPVVSDNCGVSTVLNNAPLGFPLGTNLVTWAVVDSAGNTNTCTQRVIVRDNTPPTITCPPTVTVSANAGCAATNVVLGPPVTSDNCGVATVSNNAPAIFPAGTNSVIWTVTDNSGNTNSCTQLVIVRDNTPPTITCPPDVTVSANSGCVAVNVALGTPVTSDDCGIANVFNNAPADFPLGTNFVVWTVTDTSGHTNSCTQRVIVRDNTPPTITCPPDVTVSANSGCSATNVNLGQPVTGDNCGVASVVNNAPASFPAGTNFVTWTVTDTSGNTNSCTQRVIVRDNTPPEIQCPTNLVVSANTECSATNVTFAVTATDNCGAVTIVSTPPSGSTFPAGTTTVTNIATDASGNSVTCTFTVTVIDSQPPAVSCSTNLVLNADTGQCSRSNVTFIVTATDNCGTATVVSLPPSGSTFPVGVTVVTNTATDASGNTATCTFTVTVRDVEPPTIVCPTNKTVTLGQNWTFDKPIATDNCGNVTVIEVGTVTNALCGNSFVATRTWRATDDSGNSAECSNSVTVLDTATPIVDIVAPTNGTVFIAPAGFIITANAQDANGSISSVEFFLGTNSVGIVTNGTPLYSVMVSNVGAGDYMLTALATDACGNRGTSAPVNVSVQNSLPLVVLTNLFLNRQSGFYEMVVRVFNPTAFVSNTVGVLVFNVPSPIQVVNATAFINGVPYVQNGGIVPPGGFADIKIKLYAPQSVTNVAVPTLVAVVMAPVTTASVSGTPVSITRYQLLADGSVLLNFVTVSGATYFVEYSDDNMTTWKTSPQTVIGTGFTAQWIDDGPPATGTFPPPSNTRFYRVLRVGP